MDLRDNDLPIAWLDRDIRSICRRRRERERERETRIGLALVIHWQRAWQVAFNQFRQERQRRPTSMIISEPEPGAKGTPSDFPLRASAMTMTARDDWRRKSTVSISCKLRRRTRIRAGRVITADCEITVDCFLRRERGEQWLFTLLTIHFCGWLSSFGSSEVATVAPHRVSTQPCPDIIIIR